MRSSKGTGIVTTASTVPSPTELPCASTANSDYPTQLQRVLDKLALTERLTASEAETRALRQELELYRTGVRTVASLAHSSAGTNLGNQVATLPKPGMSKRTLKRRQQRERALARRQAYGPAEQRLLDLQAHLDEEIKEDRRRQQRIGQGQGPSQQQRPFPSVDSQQQPRSYRDALISEWQMVGSGRRQGGQRPAQPKQRQQPRPTPTPAPRREFQRPSPERRGKPRRRRDAILVVPAPGVSFADMYRPIRTIQALADVQVEIRRGKRLPSGNLRMELTWDVDSADVCSRMQVVLGELGRAKVLTEMAEVLIRNVDHLTEETTIRETIRTVLNREPAIAAMSVWERADATKRARVRLPR
uniref:Uncharacterized protein n=1 Tax=Anopheles culicifacies TaxID=139723 RepID=A0A182LVH3_9DIPT